MVLLLLDEYVVCIPAATSLCTHILDPYAKGKLFRRKQKTQVTVCKFQKELYPLQWMSSLLFYVHVTVNVAHVSVWFDMHTGVTVSVSTDVHISMCAHVFLCEV